MSVSTPIVILLEAGLLAVPALTTLGAALPPPAWPPPSGFLQAVAAPTAAAHSITRRDRSAIRWVIRENIATPGSAGGEGRWVVGRVVGRSNTEVHAQAIHARF